MKKIYLALMLFMQPLFSTNVLVLTIPKSGTNLILKCLHLILNTDAHYNITELNYNPDISGNTIYWGHLWPLLFGEDVFTPSPAKIALLQTCDIKIILNLRDPRDHIIALARTAYNKTDCDTILYGIQHPSDMLIKATGNQEYEKYRTVSECYNDLLAWKSYPNTNDLLAWKSYPNTYVTSFEKLVGSDGGGSQERQIQEVMSIANFLDITLSTTRAESIARQLFGDTATFKIGKIGAWKELFDADVSGLFNVSEKNLLARLGYK